MEATTMTTDTQALRDKVRDTWIAGDFGVIARSISVGAEAFVNALRLQPGTEVLDAACGTGNTSLPAAAKGVYVTGIDIAPNLIEQAQDRAEDAGLDISFEVGDVEELPYADSRFDAVISMFGAMFAPRPVIAANEMVRVTKPGGLICMANWTPEGMTGKMFKIVGKHVKPAAGMPSPLLWGTEDAVTERFGDSVSQIHFQRRQIDFAFPQTPDEVIETFREFYGPTKKAFDSLDKAGQVALRNDLLQLWLESNLATDGTTRVVSEYLEVVAVR